MTLSSSQILSELSVLRAAWATTRAASGGLAAMAGFDFQLTKALAAIIRQAASGDGRSFVEALSDIVEADKGVLIIQAKRTLSSSAFHSALAELWQIFQLARVKTPELCTSLRFQVASRHRILRDWDASLTRWAPDDADPKELAAFKRLVSISVTPEPRFEAARLLLRDYKDPKPFERIDRMLGRLLGGTAETLDTIVEEFRLELEGEREAARERERRFELWGDEDRPPERVVYESDERLAVRLGERLSVEDLREGRLGNRRVYSAIEAECETWLASERELYKLPAYWLSGRSGCGKSAALLHLGARLHAQNPDRVILHLGERVERIADAVRWAAPLLREGRTVILILDDPFTAARQAAFARSVEEAQFEWEQLRAGIAAEDRRPPVILCCGPTEQRAAAEENCGAHIACDGFDLPIEAPEDLQELADWYAARTGKTVAPMDGNVLLVQQVFEWAKGNIADFSRRFRERIQAFDDGRKDGPTFSAVAQILALNRLYVDFPASQLAAMRGADTALDRALITLGEAESHLEFGEEGRGGVRLTHPHLANAIYMEWFHRETDRPYRKRHLEAALAAALDQPGAPPEVRHAPLWAIGRLALVVGPSAWAPDPAMQARLDVIRTELCEVLTAIYARQVASATPLEDIPVWVALRDLLGLPLTPEPVPLLIAAVDAANEPARGLRLSCHRLLGAADGGNATRDSVIACLNRMASWRDYSGAWHEWVPLAIDVVQRGGGEAILASILELVRSGVSLPRMPQLVFMMVEQPGGIGRPVVLDWLQQNPSSVAGWSTMLETIQQRGHCEETDAIALRFLAAARYDPAWPFVWRNLLDAGRIDHARLIEDGFAWIGLGRRAGDEPLPEQLCWDRVWKRLLGDAGMGAEGRARLIEGGRRWIVDVDPDHNGWTWVWQELWDSPEAQADSALRLELSVAAEIKLDIARIGLEGWSYVWKSVMNRADADTKPYLLRLGLQWIREVGSGQIGWGYVWEELFLSGGPAMRPELRERGRRWLEAVDVEHMSWAYVWRNVSASPLNVADPLVARALDWLRAADREHIAWPRTALALLSLGDDTIAAEARRLALEWLPGHPELPIAGAVCRMCLAFDLEDEAARQFAAHCARLVEDPSVPSPGRGLVWDALRQMRGPEDLLRRVALELLDAPDTPLDVQISLCGRSVRGPVGREQRSAFVGHCLRILGLVDADKAWFWLWEAMGSGSAGDRADIVEAARQRLVKLGTDHPEWIRIYIRTLARRGGFGADPVIRAQAIAWLGASPASGHWAQLWTSLGDGASALREPAVFDAALSALGRAGDQRSWIKLWRAAYKLSAADGRGPLIEAARRRLEDQSLGADWTRLWSPIYQIFGETGDDPAWLRDVALARLLASPRGDDWYRLWRAVRHHAPALLEDETVRDAGTRWLGAAGPEVDAWLDIWKWRAKYAPSPWADRDTRRRITFWLRDNFSPRGLWSNAWSSAARALSGRQSDELQAMGFEWLRLAAPHHRGWPFMWITLWGLNANRPVPRERLGRVGEQWLQSGVSHPRRDLVANRVKN